jgi:membrane protein required for beta-lactamase induction
MSNYKQFAPAAYVVGLLLFFIPFFDAITSITPWHPDMAEWRFAASGLVSNAFMIPAAGALILVGTALVFSHYKTQLWLGLFFWLMMIVVLVAMLSFTLDATQTRNGIQPEQYKAFRLASIVAEVKLLLAAVSFALLGRACRVERWFKRWLDNWLRKRTATAARA